MAFSPVKSFLTFPGTGGVESVFSLKPLQGSGGGIRRIFKGRIFNINNNNEKRFVSELFHEKLRPLQSSFVPGDAPLKFIDSQHSKQVEVQKHYQKGRSLKSRSDFCDYLFQDKASIPKTDSIPLFTNNSESI